MPSFKSIYPPYMKFFPQGQNSIVIHMDFSQER